ncbi:hypothetical protein NQ317_007043 [Molorchus minor]|uniref:Uncharacterized protein n=1 Tax=Molorchus minor TaxID=1323400 RepID=A0ABQ9JE93_9CUCU|nr:hypothetical protein NQ317_007043 [Molorchus minor]
MECDENLESSWKTVDNTGNNCEPLGKYDKMCRACLNETENMSSIYHPEIQNMFTFCTSLEVNNDVKLPNLICTQCKSELLKAYNFKDLCIKSNNILIEYMSRYKIDDIEINLNDLLRTDLGDTNININCDLEKHDGSIIDIVNEQINDIIEEHINQCDDDDDDNNSSTSARDSVYKCDNCPETFNLEEDLKTHQISHPSDGVPKCTLCNKIFTETKVLKRHVRTHLKLKPFPCTLCSKSFSESGSLTRHLRKHRGEKRHICSACGKGFYEANVLAVHMRIHTGEKPISCDICNKKFSDPGGLRSHMKSHTGERNHSHYVKIHMRQHTGELPYMCMICNKGFPQNSQMEIHLRVHTGIKPYICQLIMDCGNEIFQYYTIINDPENSASECSNDNQIVYLTINQDDVATESFEQPGASIQNTEVDNASTFDSNINIITLDDGTMFMTTASDENFDSIEPDEFITNDNDQNEQSVDDKFAEDSEDCNYEIVQVIDENQTYQVIYRYDPSSEEEIPVKKSFICLQNGCEKMFYTEDDLNVHMRCHLEVKRYACTVEGCDKDFTTNYSLKAHIRTHTGEKPYGCVLCSKCFKTSGDLQRHLRTHTGEKPFTCPIEGCDKSFTTSNIRKVHIRSHTGERPFTCNYPNCGKAFSSSTNYKNHVRIHSGEKPYVCNVEDCGKRFTEYSSLYKHNLVHQTSKPFACGFCGQNFKQESAVKLHKRVKHNVIVASDGTEIVVTV